jgi:hypothetical protein
MYIPSPLDLYFLIVNISPFLPAFPWHEIELGKCLWKHAWYASHFD